MASSEANVLEVFPAPVNREARKPGLPVCLLSTYVSSGVDATYSGKKKITF
jgi:hypothetical protein